MILRLATVLALLFTGAGLALAEENASNPLSKGKNTDLRAQYYENLTKGQYSGEQRPRLSSYFDVSRDSLNPQINLNLLRQRLRTIEMYKNRTTP